MEELNMVAESVPLLKQVWTGFTQVLNIVGGLGVFIFGMKILSDGLQKAAGQRMQKILDNMTGKPVSAISTGLVLTSIMQSSSATTVMVVSVVNAGLLSLAGAAGVIMGANIGTTLTAWIVSSIGFKISVASFALPVIAVGLPLLISSRFKNKGVAEALVGFGILFIGLGFLKEYMATEEMKEFIRSFIQLIQVDIYILKFPVFVILGTLLTVLVQSSSAAMTITLTLMSIGALSFEQGALIVLGENIGTTITAYLASLGANINAKKASRVHLIFNLAGVAWMFAAFYGFTWIVTAIIPDGTVLFGNSNSALFQLSLFHSLFNVTNTLVLMWFIPQIVNLAGRMVGKGGESSDSLKFLSHGYQEVSDALMFEAKRYLEKLGTTVKRMTLRFVELLEDSKPDVKEYITLQKNDEDETDELEEELSRFLSDLSEKELSAAHHQQLNDMIRIVAELERIGDEALTLIGLWKKLSKRNITLEEDQKKELGSYFHSVMEMMNLVFDTAIYKKQAWSNEHFIDVRQRCEKQQKKIVKGIRKRLKAGAYVRLELVYLDIAHTLGSIKTQLNEILQGGFDEYGVPEE